MEYVDGFVAAVPTANQGIYRDFALKTAALFREHGALRVVETWGDDVPEGQVTSFPMAVQRKGDETVDIGEEPGLPQIVSHGVV